MDTFLKATGIVLITIVLYLVLSKRDKEFSVLLTSMVCCIVLVAAFAYLEPVISFVRQLQNYCSLDSEILSILLKSVGIGLLAEIAALICNDVGNSALGKALQIMAAIVILWLSLPLLTSLMELIEGILGEV